jgi:hypothetical protein
MPRTLTHLDEVALIVIAHMVADFAPGWYGQRGALSLGRSDAVRYTAEGHVEKRFPDHERQLLWDAVEAAIDAHPEILTGQPVPAVELAERQQARQAAAEVFDRLARDAFNEGDYPLAAAMIDAAERENPDSGVGYRGWDGLRSLIAHKHGEMLHDEAAGRAAYAAGAGRAPALDPHIQARLVGSGVGDPRNRMVMEAFLRGYDRAADEAAAAALA